MIFLNTCAFFQNFLTFLEFFFLNFFQGCSYVLISYWSFNISNTSSKQCGILLQKNIKNSWRDPIKKTQMEENSEKMYLDLKKSTNSFQTRIKNRRIIYENDNFFLNSLITLRHFVKSWMIFWCLCVQYILKKNWDVKFRASWERQKNWIMILGLDPMHLTSKFFNSVRNCNSQVNCVKSIA